MSRCLPLASVPSHQCWGRTDELAEDLGQLAVAGLVEGEGDLAGRGLLGARDVGVVLREVGVELLGLVEGPDHVLGGDRLAVVPLGVGVHPEGRRRDVVGVAHRLGEEAVVGEDFVVATGVIRVS